EIEPDVLRIVGDVIDLAGAVAIAPLHQDETFRRNGAAVADAERIGHDLAADRPPHLDDGPALVEAPLGLGVTDDVAQSPRRRVFRVIVVYTFDRRPGIDRLLR